MRIKLYYVFHDIKNIQFKTICNNTLTPNNKFVRIYILIKFKFGAGLQSNIFRIDYIHHE
jgi:hypothetical protein